MRISIYHISVIFYIMVSKRCVIDKPFHLNRKTLLIIALMGARCE